MARSIERRTEATRAAIYARVSDKSQDTEDKTSISEQTIDMEAYCERRGLTIVARYQEVGKGWAKMRPEFQRLLADAREGRFDTIVCWKSDRLSRGMFPAAALMEVVEAHRINLEAVMDSIDMKTFGLMAAIGKIELDNFRERASMGKRGSAKQGRIPSNGIPYGYRIGEDGKPEIAEAEAEVVRRIFHQYAHEEIGILPITKQLNDDEVPTGKPVGKRWHESHVHRILKNEAYKGIWWYGKTRQVSTEEGRKIYEQPKDAWIEIPFPPLVDEEVWDRVQNIKERRMSRSKRNTKVFYMLQHLVRCAECGMLLGGRATKQNTVRRNGRVYHYDLDPPRRYYKCYGMQKRLFNCREHPFIRAEGLEDLIWGEVKQVIKNPEIITAGIEALDTQDDSGLSEEIARAELEMRDVQMEEDRAIRLYVSGKITEDQLDHQRKFITERLEQRQAKLDDYRARQSLGDEKRILIEKIGEWVGTFGDCLDGLIAERRQEVLQLIIDKVTIDRDNRVSITLAIPIQELVAIDSPTTSCWWLQ